MPDKFEPTRAQKLLLGGTFLSSFGLPFFLPTRVLSGAALAGSAGLLLWCYDEYFALAAFRPTAPAAGEERANINKSLARWYTTWMSSFGPVVSILFLPVAVASASRWIYNFRSTSSNTALGLHAAGLVLTIAHMPFGHKAFALLPYIRGEKTDNGMDPLKALDQWLQMHVRRCLLVDLPATLCFAAALFYA